MQAALEQMEELKAWDYEAKVTEVIGKLGVPDMDKKFGELSGGQKKRIFLAQLLLTEPDLIIMDEPTNHLDLSAIEWLENYLSGQNITLVGTFDHLNFQHGIIRLPSGLKVYLPHFDKFMEGDDWFKYIGKRCWAKGRLHTYTKNIEGYRGPSLELNDFSGP